MRLIRTVGLALAGVFLSTAMGCTQPDPHDLIVRGGTVLPGNSAAPTRADVGIIGDRIAAVGDLSAAPAGRVIDATGLMVAPGFIDVQGQSGTTLLADGNGESHLRHGAWRDLLAAPLRPVGLRDNAHDVV